MHVFFAAATILVLVGKKNLEDLFLAQQCVIRCTKGSQLPVPFPFDSLWPKGLASALNVVQNLQA